MKHLFILLITILITCSAHAQPCVISKSYTGHEEAIYGIAQSPDGKYLLSGGEDVKAILSDSAGNKIMTIDVHL